MVMAAWQATIVDELGNMVPNAAITVLRELPGLPPAACFSDKNAGGPLGSTFNADAEGFVRFYAAGGFYRITATSGEFSREWRDVPIGTAAGTDAGVLPVSVPPTWLFDDATADADPSAGEFRLNNANHALATAAYIDNLSAGLVDVSAWLDTLDDSGDATLRGVLTIFDPNNPATVFRTYAASGSVVDGTGYRKLTLAPIAGAGSFTPGTAYQVTFSARGPAGTGDVTGPAGATDGHAALFDGATGKLLKSAGAAPMLQGKHTIWVPASAMVSRTTAGAASVTTELATNDVMLSSKDFDQNTDEAAQFSVAMPKGWDEGPVTFVPYWTAAAGSAAQNVSWNLRGLARSDDDALDTAFGTAQESDDALIATNDLHIGPESSAITIGGTPAENDLVIFEIFRDVSEDNLAADAKLIGVKVFYTVNAATDA